MDYPAVSIYTATAWPDAEEGWTERTTLRLVNAVKCVAPEMPHAELLQVFGETNESDRSELATETPLDLRDQYVRITIGDDAWYGIIVGSVADKYGGDIDHDSGSQVIQALGLEHILTRQYITGSHVYDPGGGAVPASWFEMGRVMTFNETHIRGGELARGNRIAAKHDDAWYFVEDGEPWTVENILEYILVHYMSGPITGTPAGLISDFSNEVRVVDTAGMNLYQLLCALVDRRRGYTWSIRYLGDPAVPTITIHSLFSADSAEELDTEYGLSFSQNHEYGAVDLDDDELKNIYPEMGNRILADRIRVLGQPIRCCCTIGQNVPDHDGGEVAEIPNGWSGALETAYKAGASGEAGYNNLSIPERIEANSIVRSMEQFKRVYARFAMDAEAWSNLISLVGMTGGAGDGWDFEYDGRITRAVPNFLTWGRPFRRDIPLKDGVDYATDGWTSLVEDTMTNRPPFVAVYCGDGKWRDARDLQMPGVPNGRVALDNRGSAFWIQFSPTHRLAGEAEWAGAEFSNYAPTFGTVRTFAATVCFELDEPLQVVVILTANAHADFAREIVIHVPDAELIYAHKNTAVGVDDSGELEWIDIGYATPGGILNVVDDVVGVTLRDDSATLRAIAVLASEWYGQARATSKFVVNGMEDFARPGKYITNVTADGRTFAVNSVVTKQVWDAKRCTTTVETNWFDLDWVRVVGPNVPGIPSTAAEMFWQRRSAWNFAHEDTVAAPEV